MLGECKNNVFFDSIKSKFFDTKLNNGVLVNKNLGLIGEILSENE